MAWRAATDEPNIAKNASYNNQETDFYAVPDGIATSLQEYDAFTGYSPKSCGNPVNIIGEINYRMD